MELPRLNIRATFPQIGIRNEQSRMETPRGKGAELHSEYKPPTGNGWTQAKINIDSYPSRQAYGYLKNGDYARQRAQEGVQGMRANMQKSNADAQAMVTRAAKKGHNEIAAQAKQLIASQCSPPKGMNPKFIPNPVTTVERKSEIKGEIDPGSYKTTVDPAESYAHCRFTPAQAETYMKQEGNIDRWITYGEYDRLA